VVAFVLDVPRLVPENVFILSIVVLQFYLWLLDNAVQVFVQEIQ